MLVSGSPPALRVNGSLERVGGPAIDARSLEEMLAPHMGPRARNQLALHGAVDFSLRLEPPAVETPDGEGWRLRVNLHRQRGRLAAAIRALPHRVSTLAELNLPPSLSELARLGNGLVLVSGPTGSGKSTTLAALVGLVNRERCCHIVTIEDPVEFEHHDERSLVEQVEVGSDAPTFAAALRAALRCDPDVILVGEMRDLETIAIVLTAAETGHLVLSTLHTGDVAQAVHRMIDVFQSTQQDQIRQQLSLSLRAIVCQQLVQRADGNGRLPALEVLTATYAVRSHIRKGTVHQLYNEILVGRERGMFALEDSLARLVKAGIVTAEEARARASRPEELERMLR